MTVAEAGGENEVTEWLSSGRKNRNLWRVQLFPNRIFPPIKGRKRMCANKMMVMALAGVVLGSLNATAVAQDAVRVRGTIERAEGSTYVVKARDGAELKV